MQFEKIRLRLYEALRLAIFLAYQGNFEAGGKIYCYLKKFITNDTGTLTISAEGERDESLFLIVTFRIQRVGEPGRKRQIHMHVYLRFKSISFFVIVPS